MIPINQKNNIKEVKTISPQITVIDAIPGSGKTSYAIEFMNQYTERSYIYVTPLLSEVDRIKESTIKEFYDPVFVNGRKIHGLNDLLCSGQNIVTTHSTFSNATDETVNYIIN
jgi:superfamily II DNA or RNA helicase